MGANGVSFKAKEVVQAFLRKAEDSFRTVSQNQVDDELDELRKKSCEECDVYARDVLKLNTGNQFCS
jgi:hypothetical protein